MPSPKRSPIHVLLDTESLIEAFPEPRQEANSVYKVHNTLLLDENASLPTEANTHKRGRPPYPWKEFTAELARRQREGTLPDQQTMCVHEMHIWRMRTWVKPPSESALYENTSPFYQATKQ